MSGEQWLAHLEADARRLGCPTLAEAARRLYDLASRGEPADWDDIDQRLANEITRHPEEVAALRAGDASVIDRAWQRLYAHAFASADAAPAPAYEPDYSAPSASSSPSKPGPAEGAGR